MLPIYTRRGVYYLHTRIAGRQFKRSLRTRSKRHAVALAVELLSAVTSSTGDSVSDDFKKQLGIFELVRAKPAIGGGFEFEADTPSEMAQFMAEFEAFKQRDAARNTTPQQVPQTPQETPFEAPKTALEPSAPAKAPHRTRARARAMGQDDHTEAPLLSTMLASMLAFNTLSDATRRAYAERLRVFIQTPGIGDRIATTYTRKDAMAFQETRRAELKPKTQERAYSDATIDGICSAVRAVFKFGRERDLLPEDFASPFGGLKNLQTKKDKKMRQYGFFETAEVVKLFEQSRNDGENTRHWLAMLLCFVCGLRVGAACSFKPEDFGADSKGRPFVRVRDDKTEAGRRVVVLPSRLFEWLQPFIDEARQTGGPVLGLQNGNARAGDAVSKYANRAIKTALGDEAAARNLVLHSARKWCNSRAKAAGISDSAIMYFIGHEDAGVNQQVYTHYEPEEMHELLGEFLAKQLDMICPERPGTHASPLQKRERRPNKLK